MRAVPRTSTSFVDEESRGCVVQIGDAAAAIRTVVRVLKTHEVVVDAGGDRVRTAERTAGRHHFCPIADLALTMKDLEVAVAIDQVGGRVEDILFGVAPVTIRGHDMYRGSCAHAGRGLPFEPRLRPAVAIPDICVADVV